MTWAKRIGLTLAAPVLALITAMIIATLILLATGDDVIVIKELKLDGKSGGVKSGTKVKGIRLVPGDHPIDGKIDGRGILIKAEFVRRA